MATARSPARPSPATKGRSTKGGRKTATKRAAKAEATKNPAERRGRKKGAPRPSRDAILEAAEGVFTRQGFGNTSLRQLMAAAGVSTTAFYARFSSREDVLEAIAMRFLTDLATDAAGRLGAARNVEEGFTLGVEVLLDAVKDKRPLLRLLLSEASSSEVVRRALGDAFEQLATLLAAQLQRLVDKGIVEAADARATGWALVGALKIQLERWALFESINAKELGPALRSTAEAMLPVIKRRAR
jgi:AcrR family transcriptional regulator